jgi:putative DNA primase/helicase
MAAPNIHEIYAGEHERIRASVKPNGTPENLLVQPFNDYGNGQRVILACGHQLRYVHAFNKPIVWDGRRWAIDNTDESRKVVQQAILLFMGQAVAANNDAAIKFAGSSLNSQRISAAMREAWPYLAVRPEQLDSHPFILNFIDCEVDVRTGERCPHAADHFITKLVRHKYRADAQCRAFLKFLERVTENHRGLLAYLQKAFGYSLTGITSEKAVFLLHGGGDNGKSTLLSTFLKLLEEYAVLLQIDTLMVRQESNNTQADLADLRGARFVMTSETEEGQRLAEGKLKRITQGMGRIKAVRKYENPIEFEESHKLWIDANHLPIIRGTDNAIWNRLHPVPFDTTIPKAEQDKGLQEKLLGEGEGILAWAVAGAIRWHLEGLGRPADVEQAGRQWREESDQLGRFLEACCIQSEQSQVKARALYQAYRKWTEEAGEHAERETEFMKRVTAQGFTRRHTDRGNVYDGLGLLTES